MRVLLGIHIPYLRKHQTVEQAEAQSRIDRTIAIALFNVATGTYRVTLEDVGSEHVVNPTGICMVQKSNTKRFADCGIMLR